LIERYSRSMKMLSIEIAGGVKLAAERGASELRALIGVEYSGFPCRSIASSSAATQ
jgi:hypothetical protein